MSLFEPEALWVTVKRRLQHRSFFGWLMIIPALGALGVALAAEIGVRHFDSQWHPVFGYNARPDTGGSRFILVWSALALAPVVQGLAAAVLLPMYSRPRRWRAALAYAIVGAVPLYVSGVAMIMLPGIMIVLAGFAVGVVWWVTGARDLLEVPASEGPEFVVATLFVSSAAILLYSTALPFR